MISHFGAFNKTYAQKTGKPPSIIFTDAKKHAMIALWDILASEGGKS
jgi:hypothetical protein